jgi:hypothetical protein
LRGLPEAGLPLCVEFVLSDVFATRASWVRQNQDLSNMRHQGANFNRVMIRDRSHPIGRRIARRLVSEQERR